NRANRSWSMGRFKLLQPILYGFLSAVIVMGCDERKPSASMRPLDEPATKPSRPTTQELIEGPRTRIPLRAMPFSMEVPRGWQIKSVGGVQILEGPTPAGVAQIQLAKHGSPIPQHAERLIEGAKKEAAASPGPLTLADVREIGSFKMLETRSVGNTTQI